MTKKPMAKDAREALREQAWCEYERSGEHVALTLYLVDPTGDVWTMKGVCDAMPDDVAKTRAHLEALVRACWRA